MTLCGMRYGFHLAGITLLWLVALNIGRDCLVSHCIAGLHDCWQFPPFFRCHWQSLCTALTAGICKCLPLGLCKETVKESMKCMEIDLLTCSPGFPWSVQDINTRENTWHAITMKPADCIAVHSCLLPASILWCLWNILWSVLWLLMHWWLVLHDHHQTLSELIGPQENYLSFYL